MNMAGRFKLPQWVFPLVIAAVVGVFGWWCNLRLRETIEKELKAQLTSALNANVTALEIWTTNQLKLATALAGDPVVRDLGTSILERPPFGGFSSTSLDAEQLSIYLRSRLKSMGYETAQLVNTNLAVVATSGFNRLAAFVPVSEAFTNKFSELFAYEKPVLITPFKPELRVPGRVVRYNVGMRGGNLTVRSDVQPSPNGGGRRSEFNLMQVAAPVRDPMGAVCGALALIINPDSEFSRILSVARPGETGETYAFDQTGLLISRTRHDVQLRLMGLLAASNSSSALNMRLQDPGGDLAKAYKPDITNASARPLIRLVAEAVEGESGVDVVPSRDYRGVLVVGAWRWLPRLGFGVATQIDASEAFRPLHVLEWLFVILSLLLILSAVSMFVYSQANAIFRRRLSEVELKLRQLGQYTLGEKIGEGGMGVVYHARHALMRRDTAVKLLLPDRANRAAVDRFEREVRLTCQLTHPNTIQVYDYGHTPDGIFYYAMEYLRGLNLHDLVSRYGAQPEGRVVYILSQVCDSLSEAHDLGLIHRDIKPGNIYLCSRGGVADCVKVLDFGLVHEYRSGSRDQIKLAGNDVIEGTPCFMPPESFADTGSSDPRSDIYSVGALGYYLLTGGKYVYEGNSVADIRRRQSAGKPVPAGQRTNNAVSAELDPLILRCLANDPAQRPQTVRELRALLQATPRAGDWNMAERTRWWTRYDRQPQHKREDKATPSSVPTVRVDFADRIQPK
jgi:serine/threonine protein kinase